MHIFHTYTIHIPHTYTLNPHLQKKSVHTTCVWSSRLALRGAREAGFGEAPGDQRRVRVLRLPPPLRNGGKMSKKSD